MKKVLLFLVLPLTLTFTGCIEVLEEIYLQKGGTGTYKVTIDMSALMDESLQEMLGGMGGEEGLQNLEGLEMDSTLQLADINPEAVAALSRPEVFDDAEMHMVISDAQDLLLITMAMDFAELDDIDYFMEHLSQVAGDDLGGMSTGVLPQNGNLLSLKGRKLTRYPVEAPETPAFTEEEKAMAEMMFAGATYTTIYNFPGKVKKTTIPESEIDGNQVIVERGLLEMMDEAANIDGMIKFKWR